MRQTALKVPLFACFDMDTVPADPFDPTTVSCSSYVNISSSPTVQSGEIRPPIPEDADESERTDSENTFCI